MTFYEGAPPRVPAGEVECKFGRTGWWWRSILDAQDLLMNNLAASVAWLLTVGVVATIVTVLIPIHLKGDAGKIVTVIAGIVIGTGAVLLAISAILFSPIGRRRHWQPMRFQMTFGQGLSGVGWTVISRHWHTIEQLRIEVRTPSGEKTDHTIPYGSIAPPPGTRFGDYHMIEFFPEPKKPTTGVYCLKWEVKFPGVDRPLVIARKRWRVTQDDAERPIIARSWAERQQNPS